MFADIYAQAKKTLSGSMTDEDFVEAQRKYKNQRFVGKKNNNSKSKTVPKNEPVSRKKPVHIKEDDDDDIVEIDEKKFKAEKIPTKLDNKRKKNATAKSSSSMSSSTSSSSSSKGTKKSSSKPACQPVEDMDTDTELDYNSPILQKVVTKSTSSSSTTACSTVYSVDSDSSEGESKGADDLLKEFDEFSRQFNNEAAIPTPRTTCPKQVVRSTFVSSSDDILCLSPEVPSFVSTKLPSPKVDLSDLLGKIRIRFRFQDQFCQIDGNLGWDLEKVREQISRKTSIPANELLIYNEEDEKLQDGKTLKSYNFLGGDILEVIRRSDAKSSQPQPLKKQAGVITLKFQKASLKRPVSLNVLKKDSFRDIRASLARELGMDAKLLSFRIDGDTIDMGQTPEDLDLEDEDAVDVFDTS